MESKFGDLNFKSKLVSLVCDTDIECGTGLLSSENLKILAISSNATLIGSEIIDNQIKFSGRSIFSVTYINSDGETVKKECGSEFQNRIEKEGITSKNSVVIKLSVAKTVTAENNGNIVIKSKVIANIDVYEIVNAKYLTGGEFYSKKAEGIAINEINKKGTYPIEEEFELNYEVKEALLHQTEIDVTAVTAGVGTIIVDGEIILSVCFLQKIENSDILRESKIIPFRIELEAEEATPNTKVTADAEIKSVKLDIVVDEETHKSVVKASFTIELSGCIYEEKSIEYVVDAYSDKNEMQLVKNTSIFGIPVEKKVFEERTTIRGNFENPLPAGARLMCTGLEKITVDSVKMDTELNIDGGFEALAFIKETDGQIISMPIIAPFSIKTSCQTEDEYTYQIKLIETKVKIISLESFEAELKFKIIIDETKKEKIEFISGVEIGEEKQVSKEAMSVYIPLPGEELWDVAKRLNSCPEVIMEINSDLAFPLTGNERLLIYRQEKKNY